MDYIDYINDRLAKMPESELKDFSEQCNFGLGSALLRATKGGFKGLGRKPGFIKGAKTGFKREIAADKAFKEMWEGYAGPGTAAKLGKSSVSATKSIAPKQNNLIKFNPPKAKVGDSTPIKVNKVSETKPLRAETPELNNAPFIQREADAVGKVANETKAVEKSVANTAETASNATKEVGTTLTKFNSPAEAVAANKTIQKLDQKILDAVARGDVKGAANLRKARSEKARQIELAFHKAYSGKLRNIHEWGRDHKLVSAPIGIAGAAGAGALATAGAAGVAGVVGLNKAVDTVFD